MDEVGATTHYTPVGEDWVASFSYITILTHHLTCFDASTCYTWVLSSDSHAIELPRASLDWTRNAVEH